MSAEATKNAPPPPPKSVLKSREVRAKEQKKPWPIGIFTTLGVMIILSGALMAVTLGGKLSMILYMIGMAIFLYGMGTQIVRLALRIWREGR
jgi:predicted lysophospholipase L1 biosynthesis ABC-type transport system permease subunit